MSACLDAKQPILVEAEAAIQKLLGDERASALERALIHATSDYSLDFEVGALWASRKRLSSTDCGVDSISTCCTLAEPPVVRRRRHDKVEEELCPVSGSLELRLPSSTQAAAVPKGADSLLETDLGHLRPSLGSFEALPDGQFTIVDRLASGINGDVFAYQRACPGRTCQDVAVKKLRSAILEQSPDVETDERKIHFCLGSRRRPAFQEDALTEVGVLRFLAKQPDLPRSLLQLHGAFVSQSDSTLWLVTELADGGDLLGEVQRAGVLRADRAKFFCWQILHAVAYLHKLQIGHRDISLENVLLKGGEVRVMDFGAAVRSATMDGTPLRYFSAVGKDFYRAPECYVPMAPIVEVVAPDTAEPGEVATVLLHDTTFSEVRVPHDARPGVPCMADVWGYEAPPADVWSVGVCLFMMLVGCPAWGRANRADPLFAFSSEHGLAALLREWGKPALPAAAQALVDSTTALCASQRPTAEQCLEAAWFADLRALPVALH